MAAGLIQERFHLIGDLFRRADKLRTANGRAVDFTDLTHGESVAAQIARLIHLSEYLEQPAHAFNLNIFNRLVQVILGQVVVGVTRQQGQSAFDRNVVVDVLLLPARLFLRSSDNGLNTPNEFEAGGISAHVFYPCAHVVCIGFHSSGGQLHPERGLGMLGAEIAPRA